MIRYLEIYISSCINSMLQPLASKNYLPNLNQKSSELATISGWILKESAIELAPSTNLKNRLKITDQSPLFVLHHYVRHFEQPIKYSHIRKHIELHKILIGVQHGFCSSSNSSSSSSSSKRRSSSSLWPHALPVANKWLAPGSLLKS